MGLAQTVGMVSGANTKQKNHLGMRVSCHFGIVRALKDKDDLRETLEDCGARLRENGNEALLCNLADSCPCGGFLCPHRIKEETGHVLAPESEAELPRST